MTFVRREARTSSKGRTSRRGRRTSRSACAAPSPACGACGGGLGWGCFRGDRRELNPRAKWLSVSLLATAVFIDSVFKQQTQLYVLAAWSARVLLRSFTLVLAPSFGRVREGGGRRLAPMVPVRQNAHVKHRENMSEAGTARPPCAVLTPATSSFCHRRFQRVNSNTEPVGSAAVSTKLDRSNDGQAHTLPQYAFSAVRRKRVVKCSRASAQSSTRLPSHTSRPTPPASTAPHTAGRDDSRSAPLIG